MITMYMKLSSVACALFLLLASSITAQLNEFDITKFGGAPSGDITQAMINAWEEACASQAPSKVVVPQGTFKMKAVEFKGPCKNSVEVQVAGNIQAPSDLAELKGAAQWMKFDHIDSITLFGGGTFDGQGAMAWKQNNCAQDKNCRKPTMNFGFNGVTNSIVRDITSKDSKHFHVNLSGCKNLTFDGFKVTTGENSLNTDGIHLSGSTEVTIKNSNFVTGDDCISLGQGCKQVTVENVTCGPGHGISVGSLGKHPDEESVDGFIVKNCTLTNTTNGVRIKTWLDAKANVISNITFEDITMINVENPVTIDQEYCPFNQCEKQTPSQIKISKVSFKNIRGTSQSKDGVILKCSKNVPCDGVELNDINLTFNGVPATATCANVKPAVTGKVPICAA